MEILDTLAEMPEYGLSDGKYYLDYDFLRRAAALSPAGHMIIGNQAASLGFNSGTNACTFTDPQTQDVYVVFRGTSDGEWPDNGLGLCVEETPQQGEALRYFDLLAQTGRLDTEGNVYVSGHSKGGNKAQYVTLASPFSNLIHQCLSFDGQGFSPEAVSHFRSRLGESELEQRRQKLWSICGDNDFVNTLGIGLVPEDHITYIHTEPEIFNPAGYHDLKYLFGIQDENGAIHFQERLNETVSSQGEFARYASLLSQQVLGLPDDTRYACAMALTQAIELGGNSPVGLHGEHFTAEELIGFFGHGLPLIYNSLLYTKEGRGVLTQLCREGLETAYHEGGLPGLAAACWGGSAAALLAIRAGTVLSVAASGLEFLLDRAVRLAHQTVDNLGLFYFSCLNFDPSDPNSFDSNGFDSDRFDPDSFDSDHFDPDSFEHFDRGPSLDFQLRPLRLFWQNMISSELTQSPFAHCQTAKPSLTAKTRLIVNPSLLTDHAAAMENVAQHLQQESSALRRISRHLKDVHRQKLYRLEATLKAEQALSAQAAQIVKSVLCLYTDAEQNAAQSAEELSLRES